MTRGHDAALTTCAAASGCLTWWLRLCVRVTVCLLFAWLLTKLATCGFRPVVGGRTQAMGCFRTALLAPARWLVRVILFIFGVCVVVLVVAR